MWNESTSKSGALFKQSLAQHFGSLLSRLAPHSGHIPALLWPSNRPHWDIYSNGCGANQVACRLAGRWSSRSGAVPVRRRAPTCQTLAGRRGPSFRWRRLAVGPASGLRRRQRPATRRAAGRTPAGHLSWPIVASDGRAGRSEPAQSYKSAGSGRVQVQAPVRVPVLVRAGSDSDGSATRALPINLRRRSK